MKGIFKFGSVLALTTLFAVPAVAVPVCLRTDQIRDTQVPRGERSIVFKMMDGKVWNAELRQRCIGLRFNGFIYAPTPPNEICENLQSIRAIDTGQTCLIGRITLVPAGPPKPASNY